MNGTPDTTSDGTPDLGTLAAEVERIVTGGEPLDPRRPIGEQAAADSARMVELAIVLEDELGAELPDDADLRTLSVVDLLALLP
ncbi:hypothetical protein ACFY4C_03690 [Actinomadura viridis]|uniref:hypothetical protein n=1 Tax=Actinomadura viridis TaxID=58110 RepID=UPI0036C34575